MTGHKRPKLDESSDSSPSESAASMNMECGTSETNHLKDISTKLSEILTAIKDLTVIVQENKQSVPMEATTEVITEISQAIKGIDQKLPGVSKRIENDLICVGNEGDDYYTSEAMRIKNSLCNVWERKVQARKDAYWAKVRYHGNVQFYERWIQESPVIVPRKLQMFEFNNENEDQKILRERAVIQNFRTEIEMDKLKIASCAERVRRLDTEMEEIVFSKCSGRIADYVMDLYRRNVKHNEDISHKRWQSNEKWLTTYEENFKRDYANSSPFFKPRTNRHQQHQPERKSYADAVKYSPNVSERRPYNRRQQPRINNDLQQLVQQLVVHLNNSNNERPQFRRQGQQQRRGHFHTQRGNGNRGNNGNWRNRSNNNHDEHEADAEPTRTSENECSSFLDLDHNWVNYMAI